jgi:hypothetical protein
MAFESTPLEALVQKLSAVTSGGGEPIAPPADDSMRERFMELLVLCLATLYGKTPIPASPFDRAMMKHVIHGLDDGDAGKFSTRADDWLRLEGLVRVQEGQKNYVLNRMTLSVLSTPTSEGTLGEIFERVAAAYTKGPTPELRMLSRSLAAYFLTRLGRGAG